MALPISKLAPTAVVIAAVSCCAWPYVFAPDSGTKKPAAMLEIAAAQLSPRIGPPPARNPFFPAGKLLTGLQDLFASATHDASAAMRRLTHEINPVTLDKVRHLAPVARLSKPTRPSKTVAAGTMYPWSAAGGKGPTAARGNPPADPRSGLALNATSIRLSGTTGAEQRLAVINGRIYAERERLKSSAIDKDGNIIAADPSAPPCVVARILPDRVLLECDGRTATLSYANLVAHTKAKVNHGSHVPMGGGIAEPSATRTPTRSTGCPIGCPGAPQQPPAGSQPSGPTNQPPL